MIWYTTSRTHARTPSNRPSLLITVCKLPDALPNAAPSKDTPAGEPQYITRTTMQPINTQPKHRETFTSLLGSRWHTLNKLALNLFFYCNCKRFFWNKKERETYTTLDLSFPAHQCYRIIHNCQAAAIHYDLTRQCSAASTGALTDAVETGYQADVNNTNVESNLVKCRSCALLKSPHPIPSCTMASAVTIGHAV